MFAKTGGLVAIHWEDTKGVMFLSSPADPMEWYDINVKRTSGGDLGETSTSYISDSNHVLKIRERDRHSGSTVLQFLHLDLDKKMVA